MAADVAAAHRDHWARVLAATLRLTRDLELAQESAQEAFERALSSWSDGLPEAPVAWLTTVAKRIALDALRRAEVLRRKLPLLVESETAPSDDERPSDLLRLMFICCHPALAPESRIALTLRLVCGLSTAQVAAGLLIPEATAAARITRAKRRISGAGIPFRIPSDTELPDRLDTLLTVLHVMSAAGHVRGGDTDTVLDSEILDRAVHACRLLVAALRPAQADEAQALLALLLLTRARAPARVDEAGALVVLADQDRTRWDRLQVREGLDLITEVLTRTTARGRPPGRFAVHAVIAGLHANSTDFAHTDWPQIVRWYDELLRRRPDPVIRLNAVAARSHLEQVDRPALLAQLSDLADDPALARYPYVPALRAALLARWGDPAAAVVAYDQAIELSRSEIERQHLLARRAEQLPDGQEGIEEEQR